MIGIVVGQHRIKRQLGAGGMGVVFAAQHETLGTEVAVKILHSHCAAVPRLTQRFFNEACAAARVRHPGVVKILDFGVIPGGAVFIVMELLAGESLSKRLAQPLPCADALRIARQVASVLAAVHQHGIVHRDLKPENLILSPDPEVPGGERVRLLDFGIARLQPRDDLPGGAPAVTEDGVMLGTPLYMAPEQCRGAGPIGDRADVYALGVLLFQMLAGRPPFTAATPGELMALHLLGVPPPLPAECSVPAGMAPLLARMLAKDPAARLSAAELLVELVALGAAPAFPTPPTVEPVQSEPELRSLPLQAPATLPEPAPLSQRSAQPRHARWTLLAGAALSLITVALGLRSFTPRTQRAVASQVKPPPVAPVAPLVPTVARDASVVPVQCTVRSQPEGARVLSLPELSFRGVTPWSTLQVRGNGPIPLLLRHAGHVDQAVVLDPATDCQALARLVPQPRRRPVSPAPLPRDQEEQDVPAWLFEAAPPATQRGAADTDPDRGRADAGIR